MSWRVPILLVLLVALSQAVEEVSNNNDGVTVEDEPVLLEFETVEVLEPDVKAAKDEDVEEEGFFESMIRQALSYREEAGDALKDFHQDFHQDITTSIDGILRNFLSAMSSHSGSERDGRSLVVREDGLTARQGFITSSLPVGPMQGMIRLLFRLFNVLLESQTAATAEVLEYLEQLEIIVQESMSNVLTAPLELISRLRNFISRFLNNVVPSLNLDIPAGRLDSDMTATVILQLLMNQLDKMAAEIKGKEATKGREMEINMRQPMSTNSELRKEILESLKSSLASGALLDILRHSQRQAVAEEVPDSVDVALESLINRLPTGLQPIVKDLYTLLDSIAELFQLNAEDLRLQLKTILELFFQRPVQTVSGLSSSLNVFLEDFVSRFPFLSFPLLTGLRRSPAQDLAAVSLHMIGRELEQFREGSEEEAEELLIEDIQSALGQKHRPILSIFDLYEHGLSTVSFPEPQSSLPPLPPNFDLRSFDVSIYNPQTLPPVESATTTEIERPSVSSSSSVVDLVSNILGDLLLGPNILGDNFLGLGGPLNMFSQLSTFLFRTTELDGKSSSSELAPKDILDLLFTLDQSLFLLLDKEQEMKQALRELPLGDVDFELFAKTLATLVVEMTGIRSKLPENIANFLLEPMTSTKSENVAQFFSKQGVGKQFFGGPMDFLFDMFGGFDFFEEGFFDFFDGGFVGDFFNGGFGGDFFGPGAIIFDEFQTPFFPDLLNGFGGLDFLTNAIGNLMSFIPFRSSFSTADQMTVLESVQELLHIFLEWDTKFRIPVLAKVLRMSSVEEGRLENGLLWTPFTLFMTQMMQKVFGSVLDTKERQAESTDPELPPGPFQFREQHCPAIPLANLTPGRAEFRQRDFDAFWRSFWVYMFTGGEELLTPCRTVGSNPDLERIPLVSLPSPYAFQTRVCPSLMLSKLDFSTTDFEAANWDRFYFAYWSWLMTQGSMSPAQCYVRNVAATPFSFFPMPGIRLQLPTEEVPPAPKPFHPILPLDFLAKYCEGSFTVHEISPGSSKFDQDSSNRFWRFYMTYQLTQGNTTICTKEGNTLDDRRTSRLLPLRSLPPPALFAMRTCPNVNLLAITPDAKPFFAPAHFHQFFRNYFNALIDPGKGATNCLIDMSAMGSKQNQFSPLIGSELREKVL